MKKRAETNTHGEKRAFVVTGSYESVLPMDVYPQELMKSILIGDFEKVEGMGIYELSEEDAWPSVSSSAFQAACSADTSAGMDMMRTRIRNENE